MIIDKAKFFYHLCCPHGRLIAVLQTRADRDGYARLIVDAQRYGFQGMWIQRSDQSAIKQSSPR